MRHEGRILGFTFALKGQHRERPMDLSHGLPMCYSNKWYLNAFFAKWQKRGVSPAFDSKNGALFANIRGPNPTFRASECRFLRRSIPVHLDGTIDIVTES